MANWNFSKLNMLCDEKGIPSAKLYQNSLEWRRMRADYHAEMALKVWKDLFKMSFKFGDQRYSNAIFIYEAHVESCIQSLNSMADILAQIINILILQNSLSEDVVSLNKVVKKMENEVKHISPEVIEKSRVFKDDEIFKYISAFCNTIKHRRLLKTDFKAEYGRNMRNENGLIFEKFKYKNKNYPETWGSDILGKYKLHLFDLIIEVGLRINEHIAKI